jgi:pimeloyl-ACP methyl ester carboxylesterase
LYSLVESDAQKSPKISIKTHVEELQADPHYSLALDQVSIHMMETKLGERIPGFLWTNPNAKFTILFSHGNAMDCAVLFAFWHYLSRTLSCNLFAYDYSGYGAATGAPSVKNTMADIEAAYHFLAGTGVRPDSIIAFGQSIGTAPSCHLAANFPVRGVILQSPCVSGLQVLDGPPRCCSPSCMFCCCDVFQNRACMRKIKCPVYIMHGALDEVIALYHGHELYASCTEEARYEPYFIDNAGHDDVMEVDPEEYFKRLRKFIQHLSGGAGAAGAGAGAGAGVASAVGAPGMSSVRPAMAQPGAVQPAPAVVQTAPAVPAVVETAPAVPAVVQTAVRPGAVHPTGVQLPVRGSPC